MAARKPAGERMPVAGLPRILDRDGVVRVEVIDVIGRGCFREDAFAGQRLHQLARQIIGPTGVRAVDDQDSCSIHRDGLIGVTEG